MRCKYCPASDLWYVRSRIHDRSRDVNLEFIFFKPWTVPRQATCGWWLCSLPLQWNSVSVISKKQKQKLEPFRTWVFSRNHVHGTQVTVGTGHAYQFSFLSNLLQVGNFYAARASHWSTASAESGLNALFENVVLSSCLEFFKFLKTFSTK